MNICDLLEMAMFLQVTPNGSVGKGGSHAFMETLCSVIFADDSVGCFHVDAVHVATCFPSIDPIEDESCDRTVCVHDDKPDIFETVLSAEADGVHHSESPYGVIVVPKDTVSLTSLYPTTMVVKKNYTENDTATSIVILGDIGKVVSVGPVDAVGIKTTAPHLKDGASFTQECQTAIQCGVNISAAGTYGNPDEVQIGAKCTPLDFWSVVDSNVVGHQPLLVNLTNAGWSALQTVHHAHVRECSHGRGVTVLGELPNAVALMGNPGNTSVVHHVWETGALTVWSSRVLNENKASHDPPVIGIHDWNWLPTSILLLLTDTSTLSNSECSTHWTVGEDVEVNVVSTCQSVDIGWHDTMDETCEKSLTPHGNPVDEVEMVWCTCLSHEDIGHATDLYMVAVLVAHEKHWVEMGDLIFMATALMVSLPKPICSASLVTDFEQGEGCLDTETADVSVVRLGSLALCFTEETWDVVAAYLIAREGVDTECTACDPSCGQEKMTSIVIIPCPDNITTPPAPVTTASTSGTHASHMVWETKKMQALFIPSTLEKEVVKTKWKVEHRVVTCLSATGTGSIRTSHGVPETPEHSPSNTHPVKTVVVVVSPAATTRSPVCSLWTCGDHIQQNVIKTSPLVGGTRWKRRTDPHPDTHQNRRDPKHATGDGARTKVEESHKHADYIVPQVFIMRDEACQSRQEVTAPWTVSARAFSSHAWVACENPLSSFTIVATGPLSGNVNMELKAAEIQQVTVDGVDETDTAANTGPAKSGRTNSAENETVVACEVVEDKTSKATSEIRHSMDEEKTVSRERAVCAGVDPAKMLIGPGLVGVISEDTCSTCVYSLEQA